MSVNYLQASPLTKGLIAKAFGQSGSTVSRQPQLSGGALATAEANGIKLQEALKVNSLAEMQAFSWDKVRTAATTARISASPIVDGYFLPKLASEIFAAHEQNDVPIVIGWTANDIGTTPAIRRATNLAEYKAAANAMYGPKAAEFLELFPAANDAQARAQAEFVGIYSGFGVNTREWARAQTAKGKAPAYMWLYGHPHTYAPGAKIAGLNQATAGAYHMSDTPFWLNTIDSFNMVRTTRAWTAYDRDLANKMSDIVVAFARTGNPSTPAVKMPPYNAGNEQLVEFGDSIKVVNLNTKQLDFIANTPVQPAPAGGRGGRGGAGEGGPF